MRHWLEFSRELLNIISFICKFTCRRVRCNVMSASNAVAIFILESDFPVFAR